MARDLMDMADLDLPVTKRDLVPLVERFDQIDHRFEELRSYVEDRFEELRSYIDTVTADLHPGSIMSKPITAVGC